MGPLIFESNFKILLKKELQLSILFLSSDLKPVIIPSFVIDRETDLTGTGLF